MTVTMTALKSHVYAGKRREFGDTYEASGWSDANLLKAIGYAFDAPKPIPAGSASATVPATTSKAMTAKKPAAKKTAAGKRSHTYQRRDIVTADETKEGTAAKTDIGYQPEPLDEDAEETKAQGTAGAWTQAPYKADE